MQPPLPTAEEVTLINSDSSRNLSRSKIMPTKPRIVSKYRDVWQRARIKLQARLIISRLLDGTQSLDQYDDTHNQTNTIILVQLPIGVIHPDKKLKSYWNVFISFVLLYTAIIMPFSMAFLESESFGAWDYLDLAIDTVYIVDFLLNCCTAYYDSSGILITSRKSIILNYLKSWLVVDLFSCIPFSLLGLLTNGSKGSNKFVRFFRLPRLYKLLRMSRLIKLLNSNSQSDLSIKLQEYLSIKNSATRFCTSITTILISVHIISCLWYYTSKIEDFSPDTWVMRFNYQDNDATTLYITSVYWAFTTLTTVGYGDISAFTILEKFLSMIWMVSGLYFFAFTIGNLSSMTSSIDTKEKGLSKKLAAIDEFVADAKLNKQIAYKLRHALRYSTEITGFSWIDKQSIFNELPKQLKYQVAMAMHHGAAKHISFFVDKDVVVISFIIPFLTPLYVVKNDYVYRKDDFADEMYFIVRGRADYVLDNDEMVVSTIYQSDYFGDIEMIFQLPRKFSAISRRNLQLLAMNRKLMNALKKEYLCIWEEMKAAAIERDKKNTIYQIKTFKATRKMAKRSTIMRTLFKQSNPTVPDIVDKIMCLFEYAEDIERKIEKMQQAVRAPKNSKTSFSDSDL